MENLYIIKEYVDSTIGRFIRTLIVVNYMQKVILKNIKHYKIPRTTYLKLSVQTKNDDKVSVRVDYDDIKGSIKRVLELAGNVDNMERYSLSMVYDDVELGIDQNYKRHIVGMMIREIRLLLIFLFFLIVPAFVVNLLYMYIELFVD